MHKFVRNLLTEWRRLEMPFADESVIVAVSGGADSVSLLLALAELVRRKKLDLHIVVAHFNHNLRGAASRADEEFVKRLADHLGSEFVRGEMKAPKRGNLEQTARNARYRFLTNQSGQFAAFSVLTAHTLNDQAETLLMNLIRGSGPGGLGGMRPVRPLDDQKASSGEGQGAFLVRPLLRWAKRSDTEEFCHDSNIDFRNDAMNEDTRFTRVRIRKELIPKLTEFNPKIVETLARTAETFAGQHQIEPIVTAETLALGELSELSQRELYNILRSWLAKRRGDLRSIDLKHIAAIERLIRSRRSGRSVELPGFGRVSKHGGSIAFEKIKVEK